MKKLILILISMTALLAGCTTRSEKADPSTENAVKLGTARVVVIETGEPLSGKQISNINKGFTDDIGRIVLSYNTDLAKRAQSN